MALEFGSAFTQAVTFSCTGLPVYASCTFSPPSLAPSGSVKATAVTISTGVSTVAALAAALAGLALFGGFRVAGLHPRYAGALYRRVSMVFNQISVPVRALIAGVSTSLVFALVSACGGGGGGSNAGVASSTVTPAGTYPVTITATGGGVTKSLSYSLTVQ
jgi:hypothetical protein